MAQVSVLNRGGLEYLNIEKYKSYRTKAEWVRGCVITQDGITVLSNEECVIGIGSEGQKMFTISTSPYSAFDVTCIDNTTLAVTSGTDQGISILDPRRRNVKKYINVYGDCYGVTYINGKLLVCVANRGIFSINLTNGNKTTIARIDFLKDPYITSYEDKLYYTNNRLGQVACCDMEGNTIWSIRPCPDIENNDRLRNRMQFMLFNRLSLFGLTTDNTGRIYVCESPKSKVIVMSNDGQQSKTLISKDDTIDHPYAVHYDKTNNNLLVANNKKRHFCSICYLNMKE